MIELPIHNEAEKLMKPAAGEMDLTHFEAAQEGNINKFPFCDIGRSDLSEIFDKVSPSGNSLLHVASKYGHKEMTQLIASNFPPLITKRNSEGNTPLHLALKGQKLEVVRILVSLAGQHSSTYTADLPSIKNDEGNTALHEALLAMQAEKKNAEESFVNVIFSLVLMDPKVSYHQNDEGKSPICLAVESGKVDILEYMIIRILADQNSIPVDSTMRGKSPVHVAIEQKKIDMLNVIGKYQPDLLNLPDKAGNTPLHWAASVGYFEGVEFLLKFNNYWALQRNEQGHYPLHLACENGHEKVIKELYTKWPDATELLCNKGQNILHVAAKSGKERVVRFLLKQKEMYQLFNKKDKDGNTPFHLAALHGRCVVVATLLWGNIADADIVNHQGQTAYDISKANIPGKEKNSEEPKQANQDKEKNSTQEALKDSEDAKQANHGKDQQTDTNSKAATVADENNIARVGPKNSEAYHEMMTLSILFMYHEVYQRFMNKINRRPTLYTPRMKSKAPLTKEDLNNRINNLLVVAALIVGAAFTGSLQVPVGENVDQHTDKDVWKKLGRFMFANLLAMNLALTAALALCLALLVDDKLAKLMIWVAFVLLELALLSMSSAFWWAMRIRSMKYKLYNITLDFLDFISFDAVNVIFRTLQAVLLTIPLAPLLILLTGWEVIALFIYFILFCFYYPLYCLRHAFCSPGVLITLKSLLRGLVLLFFLLLGIYIIFC